MKIGLKNKSFHKAIFIYSLLSASILLAQACSMDDFSQTIGLYQDAFHIGAMNKRELIKAFAADKGRKIPWLCYYGNDRKVLSLPDYSLLILESDALGPVSEEEKADSVRTAYMSLGEISQSRPFWQDLKDKAWLLEENPDWPGSRRVDPRAAEWRDLLLDKIAPALLAAGYDGFMLDNVDMGEYLENLDPKKYAGAKEAMVNLIRDLRSRYPEAVIIANGGFETVSETDGAVDAVISESNFFRWILNEDASISYAEVSPLDRLMRYARLSPLIGMGIPILALEYADPATPSQTQRAHEAAAGAGFHPYIAERSLMVLPTSNK